MKLSCLPVITQSAATAQPPGPLWAPINFALVIQIPRSARPACETHCRNFFVRWLHIQRWPITGLRFLNLVLFPPTRGDKRHNFASIVKKRVSDFSLEDCSTVRHASDGSFKTHSKSHTPSLAQVMEDGNLRAAIRLLNSEDTPAAPSDENLRLLQDKHPPASGFVRIYLPPRKLLVLRFQNWRCAMQFFPSRLVRFASSAYERPAALSGVGV